MKDEQSEVEYAEVKSPRSTIKIEALEPVEVAKPVDAEAKAPSTRTVSLWELYRFGNAIDKVCIALGVLIAAANGGIFPLNAVVFGDAIEGFMNADGSVNSDAVNSAALNYWFIAIALFVTEFASYALFSITAERQMKALREAALHHMLQLDIAWYDSHEVLQLSNRITGDTVKIKDGMGYKLGDSVKFLARFVAGYAIGLVQGWEMSLIMACVMPLSAASLGYLLTTATQRAIRAYGLYAEAGAVAEETIGAIRTVTSLNGEKRAIQKYNERVATAERENLSLAKAAAVAFGIFLATVWIMYSVGLWYGGSQVAKGETSPTRVFQAFFAVLMGTFSLAQVSPNISAVAEARGAAATLYEILDTKPEIDASGNSGIVPPTRSAGAIVATNVSFSYPSRLDVQILNNYSLTIKSGQTVAFVGPSGGGKSTLVSLLERFYDPTSGSISLDGRDLRTLNVQWLRSQIGLVSQEPVLFATTIFENIAAGARQSTEVTREQVIEAAKLANAHTFIMSLPQKYDTLVGEKGVSLSGGQKQRVAIARAIIRDPSILVLDEATSALDSESERVVQAALNNLMAATSMTTLVIAHRLNTIRHADKIVVVSDGRVAEEGTHDELMAIEKGIYKNLYVIQNEQQEQEAAELLAMQAAAARSISTEVHTRKVSLEAEKLVDEVDGTNIVEKEDVPSDEVTGSFSILEAMRLSKPERGAFVSGMVSAALMGFALPVSAVLVSELITNMTLKYTEFQSTHQQSVLDDLYDEVRKYAIWYLVGAVILMLGTAIQTFSFRYMAEKLTSRLRDMHFSALCRQRIAFFDEPANGTGALAADLATHATKVSLISGDAQGRVVQALFTFVSGFVISFTTGSWQLTLVMLAVFPLLIAGHIVHTKAAHKPSGVLSDELAEVGALASEALTNIRTVQSLGRAERIDHEFSSALVKPLKSGRREAQFDGLALGSSWLALMGAYGLLFWYGGKLVDDGTITFSELLRTMLAVMMASDGVGTGTTFLADSRNAIKCGSGIMKLQKLASLNEADGLDETSGVKLTAIDGRIEFRGVEFTYPSRKQVTVLSGFNVTIEAGQTVAFCGPSGGGKSTCVSLVERFYDPVQGLVLLDGVDTKELNIHWLRSQIGLVGQEPTLFIGTIAENIAMGLDYMPSQEEIEEVAKMANAHDFITQFPDGYQTQVGLKGEQLSGGQKQRIAIARAILKNPPILLLDEATSALDSESEKIVQEALDKVVALKKRTTIIIAHRLSTIRKADKICVVSGGKIAEQGTHQELIARNGIYAKLASRPTMNS